MNYTKLPTKALLLLATPVMLTLAVPASKLMAQSQTETKIRLMGEALRACESGDLTTAKANLEQLLVLAPNDVTVKRILDGVNESISTGSGAAVPAVPAAASPETLPVVTYDPNRPAAPAALEAPAAPSAPAAAAVEAPASAEPVSISATISKDEEERQLDLIARAATARSEAANLAKEGNFDAADATLAASVAALPANTLTQDTLNAVAKQRNELLLAKSQSRLAQGDTKGAKEALDAYIAATSPDNRAAQKQAAKIDRTELNPPAPPIEKSTPNFIADQKNIAALSARARSQYAAGAIDEAQSTFQEIETYAADNAEAKYFLKRIADDKARIGVLNREKTRAQMVEEVAKGWQRPGVFVEKPIGRKDGSGALNSAMERKLDSIIIPTVSFTGVEIGRVVSTLSALSEEFDPAPTGQKGVNLVLSNPLTGVTPPQVNITLRNLSLKRVLDIITENVEYTYVIDNDLVQIKPSGGNVNLSTEQFSLSKQTLTRMTGIGAGGGAAPAAAADPFAPAPAAGGGGGSGGGGGESDAIRRFFQAAGVNFEGVPGSSLVYDGTGIIVTQTGRNIEKIRNILGRYNNDIRQVEIEAKFMDVQEGNLEELGLNFSEVSLSHSGNTYSMVSGNRSLASAFTSSSSGTTGGIVIAPTPEVTIVDGGVTTTIGATPGTSIPIINNPPSFPGLADVGGGAPNLLGFVGTIGSVAVQAQLRALSRQQGVDLLSAPKVTVQSGTRATITVAQELRYPQSYGEIQSDVGSSGNGGGSAGVTITAGTPQDFTSRNVGVELGVTPTVEDDKYSITLELNPRVTEFEGFVEYGGQSIAISAGTTVTVPSGFYQPVFSSREINTKVTIWDGATLVMGGLTREEVRRVNDKVPVLGDIPFIGRAFRSKGETSQKRNLLVFVTANLVSPGGSLQNQSLKGTAPSSLFQNPTVVTPGGSDSRVRTTVE
jgi:general secretion pathway protein D